MNGRIWLLALVVLATVRCSPAQPTPLHPASAGSAAESSLIVGVQGDAAVKRAGWADYAPILFGASFRRGDLLRLSTAGRALIACADLKLATVESGVSGFPCQTTARSPLVYEGALLVPTRGGAPSAEYPIVVSPRKTKMLSSRPILRWQAVPGVTTYKISIQGGSWTTEATSVSEVAYPESAPALQPGATYRLVVVAGDRTSNAEPGAGLGFTLLAADQARTVRDAEARIRAMSLAETPTALLIANVYATNGLFAEAIELLEQRSAAPEPAVLRLLGDLYIGVGLNWRAEERYAAALDRSMAFSDVEGQAQSHRALGRIYEALGNSSEARQHLAAAASIYEQLGDTKNAADVRAQLDALPR